MGARVWAPKPVYRAPKRPEYVTADRQADIACSDYLKLPYFGKSNL